MKQTNRPICIDRKMTSLPSLLTIIFLIQAEMAISIPMPQTISRQRYFIIITRVDRRALDIVEPLWKSQSYNSKFVI
jgi:hypothetical protein